MVVYGIPNCNTVKKARTWLSEHGITYDFHDFKKQGISAEKIQQWSSIFGWEKVLNKKGTTWKKLSPNQQEQVIDEQSAISVLMANTSAVKRPVIEKDGKPVLIGFDEEHYNYLLI